MVQKCMHLNKYYIHVLMWTCKNRNSSTEPAYKLINNYIMCITWSINKIVSDSRSTLVLQSELFLRYKKRTLK